MAIRYKTTTLNGRPILSHRKAWILRHGEIPENHCVHHKNGDKFDNRLENLELMSSSEHTAHHNMGHTPWNKGLTGDTEWHRATTAARNINSAKINAEVYEKWNNGRTQVSLAEEYGVSRRQICDRLRHHRRDNNLPNGRRPPSPAKG